MPKRKCGTVCSDMVCDHINCAVVLQAPVAQEIRSLSSNPGFTTSKRPEAQTAPDGVISV